MSRDSPSVGWREMCREMHVPTGDEREEDDDV